MLQVSQTLYNKDSYCIALWLYEYYIQNMQSLANMLIDNYSYLRSLLYIVNVSICFYSAMVQNSILHTEALPHIIFTVSCCILFCLVNAIL